MISLRSFLQVCLILVCFFCCKSEPKQDQVSSEINSYESFVNAMRSKGNSTGNILVYQDGEVSFQSANGLRSINPIDSLDLDSKFRLASVSKQFTGMAIMKLKEAGKLDYDQRVNTILPEFPYDDITVRHLLHHTSGLTDYMRLVDENLPEDFDKANVMLGNDEVMVMFFEMKPELDFQPGERWEYSNSGYMFLASIVEKISGQHFSEFLKSNVFEPLNMKDTSVFKYQKDESAAMSNRVFGYGKALNQVDFEPRDYHFLNGVRGDGGIYSTLDDLYKWNMALANYTIIPKSYLDEAWTSGKTNNGENTGYGFGWFLDYNPGEPKVVNHSGGWVGFVTFLYNAVDSKDGFIILTNDSGEQFETIMNAMFALKDGKTVEMPKPSITNSMAQIIFEDGVSSAIAHYKTSKSEKADAYSFEEGEINILGYELMNEKMNKAALQIFKLNVEEYPKSANVYDSYADALVINGDSLKALENYRKCFAMDSTLTYAKDKAEKLATLLE